MLLFFVNVIVDCYEGERKGNGEKGVGARGQVRFSHVQDVVVIVVIYWNVLVAVFVGCYDREGGVTGLRNRIFDCGL